MRAKERITTEKVLYVLFFLEDPHIERKEKYEKALFYAYVQIGHGGQQMINFEHFYY